ncbi:MAG: hypothetical protein ABH817_02490 [archaeon]
MRKELLLLILVFALLPLAAAEFTIEQSLETNSVCPSSTILITEKITTTESGTFTNSLSGSASQFATAVPTGFYLNSGQTQLVYVYITPSSKTNPGNYQLTFQAEANGQTKTKTQNIIVENCHNTRLTVNPSSQSLCSCERGTLTVTVTNNGNYVENYQISTTNSFTTLSKSSFSLNPSTSTNIQATLEPGCDLIGDYEIAFQVTASNQHARADGSASVSILPCYQYSLTADNNYYNICENQNINIPIRIRNTGTSSNNFAINIYGPSWVNSEKTQLRVGQGEEKSFNLIAKPPFKTTGSFDISIEALSDLGKVLKKTNVKLDVSECYGLSLLGVADSDKLCAGEEGAYEFKVKNLGKQANNFDFELTAPEWASLSSSKLTLNPDTESTVTVNVNLPITLGTGDYNIGLRAFESTSKIQAQDKLVLSVLSIDDCFEPSLVFEKTQVNVAQDNTATVSFTLENKGAQTGEYIIELTGDSTKFVQVNPSSVTLNPQETKSLYVYIAPSPEVDLGSYDLTVKARLKDSGISSSGNLRIIVEEGTGLPPEESEKPTEGFWTKIVGFFAKLFSFEEPEKTVCCASGPVIAEPVYEYNLVKESECVQPDDLVGFTYLLVEDSFCEPETPETPEEPEYSPPKQIRIISNLDVEVGKEFTIELDEYFEDDEEELAYVAIKPADLSVTIKGTKAIILAPQAFEGVRTLFFYVTDGGDILESNHFTIAIKEGVVEESKETPPITGNAVGDFFGKYKNYIIGAVIIALIIILLLTGVGKKIISFFEEEVPTKEENSKPSD